MRDPEEIGLLSVGLGGARINLGVRVHNPGHGKLQPEAVVRVSLPSVDMLESVEGTTLNDLMQEWEAEYTGDPGSDRAVR